jgi:hypothetical protein
MEEPLSINGSLRIAIGQLFDYSRFLPHRGGHRFPPR